MLTAAEIAGMRATQAEAMPDSCTIYRPAFTATDAGGERPSTATTVGSEACRVWVISRESERVLSGRYASLPQYLITLGHDTDALIGDYVVFDSQRYELVGKLEDGAWLTATRFVAVRHPA